MPQHDGKPTQGEITRADPWDDFEANNARIRQEFAIYDDVMFKAGRAGLLRAMLQRGPIFRVLTELEAPARANLERHIADLTH